MNFAFSEVDKRKGDLLPWCKIFLFYLDLGHVNPPWRKIFLSKSKWNFQTKNTILVSILIQIRKTTQIPIPRIFCVPTPLAMPAHLVSTNLMMPHLSAAAWQDTKVSPPSLWVWREIWYLGHNCCLSTRVHESLHIVTIHLKESKYQSTYFS